MGKPGVALTELAKRILSVHTSPQEAGRVFSSAKPRLAVYTHIGAVGGAGQTAPQPADFIAATRETYSGPLQFGEDQGAKNRTGGRKPMHAKCQTVDRLPAYRPRQSLPQ